MNLDKSEGKYDFFIWSVWMKDDLQIMNNKYYRIFQRLRLNDMKHDQINSQI